MGCAVSCVEQTSMALFGRRPSGDNDAQSQAILERKLYLAKESPESDFDLSDCQLRKVPQGVYSFCKVVRKENLYLNSNLLHSVEDGGQLSDLYLIKNLNISNNKFTKLPSDIRYLVSLTELHVDGNNIEQLPEEIQHLQNLQVLNVSRNKLYNLPSSIGKLKSLCSLNITENPDLKQLCPELCLADKVELLALDADNFVYPPTIVTNRGTAEIMKFLCQQLDIPYRPPIKTETDSAFSSMKSPTSAENPFERKNTISWEEQEAAIIEQENKIHVAAKAQREKFLTEILKEQSLLDSEIAKLQDTRDAERINLIKAIQKEEQDIQCLVNNFIESENLKPEIVQQQLAHEQAEHDRLLEMSRQNYDNIKKVDVLKAMEQLLEEDYVIQNSKKSYEDSTNDIKQSIILQDLEGSGKLQTLLTAKDETRSTLVQQLLEDQDIQKAVVASLMERVDARSWSLNEEISLISSNLAKLSVIEQEKKKHHLGYNYNELLQQRVHLVSLLDDLLDQRNKRRKQLIETLKEMDNDTEKTTDFWLKNYQSLLTSAPKNLINVSKHLDPILANCLLQEGVIHCLPFLVKFIFSGESLTNITLERLKGNGVQLSSDREGIIQAINDYLIMYSKNQDMEAFESQVNPTASYQDDNKTMEEQPCSGVVSVSESELSNSESECVICMERRCEVVFVPCGHMCCCQPCAAKDLEGCPMCRSDIERKIRVILA